MTRLINLQNTPTLANLVTEQVTFANGNVSLRGAVYKLASAAEPLPGIIVTGAWTTVKEQMAGTYARELAAKGFAALVFDFSGWGESTGERRYIEDPATKTADIHAAVDYLASRNDVNQANISGLGICASSGYMAAAVADNDLFSKLTLVAPWLHTPAMAEAIYGGVEASAKLIAASEAEEQAAEPKILTAASGTDETAPMYQAPYYTEEHRGLIGSYDNKFSVLSWKPWLTYDALESADRLSKPALLVGSTGIALPAGAEAYQQKTKAPIERIWLGDDVNQFDFYDREDIVQTAVDGIVDFLTGRSHAH